jgi:hypothetical protein
VQARPFTLEPESALLPARGSRTFEVTFDPATAHMHRWQLVGDCGYAGGAELPPMFVELSAPCVKPHLDSAHQVPHDAATLIVHRITPTRIVFIAAMGC